MNAGFFFFSIHKQATIHFNSDGISGASVRPTHFPHLVTATSPRTRSENLILPTNVDAISLC